MKPVICVSSDTIRPLKPSPVSYTHLSAHAVAYARKLAPAMKPDQIIVVNLSGRGDKDVAAIARYRGVQIYE